MFRLMMALVAISAVAMAQETWGGLRFGMTEAEAEAALKNRATRSIRDVKAEQPPKRTDVYAAIQVTDVKADDLNGTANLIFETKTNTLVRVSVDLKLDTTLDPGGRMAYVSSLQQSLTRKYGKPVVDYHCDPFGIICTAMWRGEKQGIELEVIRGLVKGYVRMQAPRMIGIIYTPATTDPDL